MFHNLDLFVFFWLLFFLLLFWAAQTPEKSLLVRSGDLRWKRSLALMQQTDGIRPIITHTQTLKTIPHKKESNYFSFCRIIRPFSRIRTPVTTNGVLPKLAFWHLGFSLNFFFPLEL